jgi:DNA-3-methyladenine glycosylase
LGISRLLNANSLSGDVIWIEDRGLSFTDEETVAAPRIGVDYAKEDALLPYRFYVKDSPFAKKK